MTHLKQSISQCPSDKRTSVSCCVPGVRSRRGGGGRASDRGRLPILGLGAKGGRDRLDGGGAVDE